MIKILETQRDSEPHWQSKI